VYFEDTDLQGITYHVSYARFCERALFDMIRTIWPDMGTATWMKRNKSNVSRLDVRYINSTTLGDRLDVLTGLLGMSQHKIVFGQRILLAGTTQVVVDATTEVEFRDERERLVPIPRQIVDIGMATLYPKGSPTQRGGKR
jgi:acyl-CoA thioester hydrolase